MNRKFGPEMNRMKIGRCSNYFFNGGNLMPESIETTDVSGANKSELHSE